MRVVSSTVHLTAMADLQRAQRDLFEAQRQAGSENRADDLLGFGRDAASLLSARGFLSESEAFIGVGKEAGARLSVQAVALEQLQEAAKQVKDTVAGAIGLDRSDELMEGIRQAFESAAGALNVNHAGKYVFGGVRETAPPFTASSLNDVATAAAVDDLFVNAPGKVQLRISVTATVTAAPLADEIGRDFMAVVRRLTDFETTYGPLGGTLTPAERADLQSILGDAGQVMDDIITAASMNGGTQKRVENVVARNEDQQIYYNNLVADVQQADLAEVATRISQAQLQLNASSQIYAQLSRLSLLDYLR